MRQNRGLAAKREDDPESCAKSVLSQNGAVRPNPGQDLAPGAPDRVGSTPDEDG